MFLSMVFSPSAHKKIRFLQFFRFFFHPPPSLNCAVSENVHMTEQMCTPGPLKLRPSNVHTPIFHGKYMGNGSGSARRFLKGRTPGEEGRGAGGGGASGPPSPGGPPKEGLGPPGGG